LLAQSLKKWRIKTETFGDVAQESIAIGETHYTAPKNLPTEDPSQHEMHEKSLKIFEIAITDI